MPVKTVMPLNKQMLQQKHLCHA